jgi:VWFA-related protein
MSIASTLVEGWRGHQGGGPEAKGRDVVMKFCSFSAPAPSVLVTLAALTLGASASAGAQPPSFKSGIDMVPLTVTVTDGSGNHVKGLTNGDFVVLEDGVQQPLSFFASGDVPIDVALVIDASSSMGPDLPLVKKAACGLIRTLRAVDRGTVVEVKDAIRIPQALTPDRARIEASVQALRASGSTALYDGVYVMLREFDRARRASPEVRRQVLVLLSDGLDNKSHLPFEAVMDLARRGGVNIYVVALRGQSARLPRSEQSVPALEAEYAMRTIAREAGGRVFFPTKAEELPEIYGTIAQELANQYDLGYVPIKPGGDGVFRRVMVRLAPPANAAARTRSGYYASGSAASTPGLQTPER